MILNRDLQLAHFWETGEVIPDALEWYGRNSDSLNSHPNQYLFINVAVALGKDSLEMLLPGEMQKFEKRLEELRQLVKLADKDDIGSNPGTGEYDETIGGEV